MDSLERSGWVGDTWDNFLDKRTNFYLETLCLSLHHDTQLATLMGSSAATSTNSVHPVKNSLALLQGTATHL